MHHGEADDWETLQADFRRTLIQICRISDSLATLTFFMSVRVEEVRRSDWLEFISPLASALLMDISVRSTHVFGRDVGRRTVLSLPAVLDRSMRHFNASGDDDSGCTVRAIADELAVQIEQCEPIFAWRHKLFAHLDESVAREVVRLPNMLTENVLAALRDSIILADSAWSSIFGEYHWDFGRKGAVMGDAIWRAFAGGEASSSFAVLADDSSSNS